MSNGHDSPTPQHPGDSHELGGYRVLRRLGRGGMGTVYLAQAPSGAQVALKVVHPDLADDESFRLRFAREVASARRVARFSTAGVIDARLEGDPLFVVSEYIDGPDLSRAVRRQGPMLGGTLESVAVGVAAALTAIHGSGIVHRDLKPANVLLSPVGPKVIDFGIARALEGDGPDGGSGGLTRSNQLMGTPSYMAPELLHGARATPAADVFAWGCLVAFAGTGRAPFDAATVPAVLHNISNAEPRLEGLDPRLLPLVTAALNKDPALRPTSQQVLDQLVGRRAPAEEDVRRTLAENWTPPPSRPEASQPAEASTADRESHVVSPGPTLSDGPQPTPEAPRTTPEAPRTTPPGGSRSRRGRLLLGVGAGTAAVALTAGLIYALAAGDDDPPENLDNLYRSDFATNPNWGSSIHDPDEDPHIGGYLPGEGLMMALDPAADGEESSRWSWYAPVVSGVHSAQRLLVGTDVQVVEGHEYLGVGVLCVRNLYPATPDLAPESEEPFPDLPDPEYQVIYWASLRADGDQAMITKREAGGTPFPDTADLPEPEELASADVPEFHPYPAVAAAPDDTERAGEEPEPVSNSVKFACEFTEGGDGEAPTAELRLWVNDEFVVGAVDEEPYPARYAGSQVVQRQAVQYDLGSGNQPVRVLFESFRLDEILDD